MHVASAASSSVVAALPAPAPTGVAALLAFPFFLPSAVWAQSELSSPPNPSKVKG